MTQYTILIIDDDRAIRQSIAAYLEDCGYETLTAKNGAVGIEVFSNERPHLVLVDLRMPEMDGIDVLARIRKMSADTPMIVVSGAGVMQDAVDALHHGAWGYLLKPIEDFAILTHTIEGCLEKAQLREDNRTYQKHLEKTVAELKAALEHVKTLQGIIPICTHCHRIRHDDQAWHRLEAYIEAHSEAEFSHSICPACAQEHYPDMDLYE